MNILSDSFSVLVNHWRLIIGILLILLPCQLLVWFGLKSILGDRLTPGEYYSLSTAGWTLPALLTSALWVSWRFFQEANVSSLILFFLIPIFAMILFLRNRKGSLKDSNPILLLLLGLFGLFIFLRLAFVSKTPIPLYFDSAHHYFIIKNLLGNPASHAPWLSNVYYHTGFHFMAAFIASILHADIINIMLILGQIILAVIPLGVFFLVKHETRSSRAGIFAVLLAAFGWYMPAHAMDWGKYPALTSLALIVFVVSLAYVSSRYRKALPPGKYLSLNAILCLALIASVFVHSRSLVIFGIVALAWVLTAGWSRLSILLQWICLGAVIVGIAMEIYLIETKDVLGPLFDPYVNKGLLLTGIVLFLTLFAQWAYSRLTFAIMLSIFLLLGSLFIPVQGLPGYIDLTLLDRPFVEMILFLPLSLLGGLGLAGLEQISQTMPSRRVSVRFAWTRYISVFFFAVILINALFKYEVYPSGCCSIVGRDDVVAMDWMDKNLPMDARIATASTEMRVMATDSFQGTVGGDAGIWINPLTGRETTALPYLSDFSDPSLLASLCQMGITHIYVGETGLTFDDTRIAPHPEWYQPLLAMPKVKVYRVIGCP